MKICKNQHKRDCQHLIQNKHITFQIKLKYHFNSDVYPKNRTFILTYGISNSRTKSQLMPNTTEFCYYIPLLATQKLVVVSILLANFSRSNITSLIKICAFESEFRKDQRWRHYIEHSPFIKNNAAWIEKPELAKAFQLDHWCWRLLEEEIWMVLWWYNIFVSTEIYLFLFSAQTKLLYRTVSSW